MLYCKKLNIMIQLVKVNSQQENPKGQINYEENILLILTAIGKANNAKMKTTLKLRKPLRK